MACVAFVVQACLVGVGLYLGTMVLRLKRSNPFPPGPPGFPVIGNLFLISTSSEKPWEQFATLGRKYGDIVFVNMLGMGCVILNSRRAISEILEKQSGKCSNRPHFTMALDLIGLRKVIVFMDCNDRLRHYRKHFHRLMGSKQGTAVFNSVMEEEIRRFLCKVLQKPEDLVNHIRATIGSIILKVTYGYTIQEGMDPFVNLADKTMSMISSVLTFGKFLVDIVPSLRYLPEWLPGMDFLQEAKNYHHLMTEAVSRPHKYVMEQMEAGTALPSFSSRLLEGGVSADEEDLIMWTSASIYLGASDTTTSAIHAFFLAMVLYPEVQAKAQAELDAVVGNERLPTLNDCDSLPYVQAVCKEVLRWHSVAPLAVPHVASEDIHSNGYVIPKGSYIIGNVWAVLHDESTYPDSGVFRPERFLGEAPQPDPQDVCFGFGRRICPGYHFAEVSLFISVAMSLAVLNVSKDVVGGVEVTPRVDCTPGTISHPKPFRFRITARSPRVEALLHASD